jgi:hypothetical protein
MKHILVALLALGVLLDASAATARHRSTVAAFKRTHVCPATKRIGNHPCPGFIVDHVKPLCKGGPDAVTNMQWQSVVAAKAKDKWECR